MTNWGDFDFSYSLYRALKSPLCQSVCLCWIWLWPELFTFLMVKWFNFMNNQFWRNLMTFIVIRMMIKNDELQVIVKTDISMKTLSFMELKIRVHWTFCFFFQKTTFWSVHSKSDTRLRDQYRANCWWSIEEHLVGQYSSKPKDWSLWSPRRWI